jgi:hypothetical protein
MGNQNNGRRPNLQRRKQVAEMRAQGLTFPRIAEIMGLSWQRVRQIHDAFLKEGLKPKRKPTLTVRRILKWADAHFKKTGAWPNQYSGRLLNEPAENWGALDQALRYGSRGLAGGSTLFQVLRRNRRLSVRPPQRKKAK